ncbi:uncharacterized protein LOC128243603 [Mya arenaria]|uniref:uncharacterized protein LOC128243603 n=1 Tax=Mya arenaria TaxID=6604 RepID=UPI0022E28B4B|nr:uncharacterized protein LOC128243603 [Mya arenaria]
MEVSGKRRDPDIDKGCGEKTQMEVSGKKRDPDLDKGCGEETQMEVSGRRRDPGLDKACGEETQMEVSGKRRDPDLDKGSADTTVYCQPCEEGGKRAVGYGFCQTCKEYMCDPCIEAHTMFKVSRNHIILSKEKMLSFYQAAKQVNICDTEYCKVHTNAMVKFYCPTHRSLSCGICVVFDHSSCKLDYIVDVTKEFVNGKEFIQLRLLINRADDLLSGSTTNVKELLDEVENHSKNEIERLIMFRAEINAYLDCRERELRDSMQKMKDEDVSQLNSLNTDCQSAKAELEAMMSELNSGKLSVHQRYMAARIVKMELPKILDEIEKMAGRMKIRKFRFKRDPETGRLLESKTPLGTVDIEGHVPDLATVTWKKKANIYVRTSLDRNSCFITGSTMLSPGLLLMTDRYNNSVKLVDVTTRAITSQLQLPDRPWDVCAIPDDQAAVTLPAKSMIQLFSSKGCQLSYGKQINVSCDCHGIVFMNNKLYVSYITNPRIEVMTIDGQIVTKFKNRIWKQLFRKPYYLTMSASTPPTIYVSDNGSNSVLQLSLDGKVLREYRDKQLRSPMSVVKVWPGHLLVCGEISLNLMLLTEGDGKMTEILRKIDGLSKPYSVAFCPHTRCLLVGMGSYDSLKVFKA